MGSSLVIHEVEVALVVKRVRSRKCTSGKMVDVKKREVQKKRDKKRKSGVLIDIFSARIIANHRQ